MRRVLAAIGFIASVSVASVPTVAVAQDYLGTHLEAQRYDNLRRHQQRIAQKRKAERRPALSPHQRACAKRYRSYDPRSDRYLVRPGVTAPCRL
ncbi:BA14K family protein [Sphingomonas sp. UNC305MFCol5.2]|uniref:BA14K family protein n=1 Tax=Sphingomonas sp. UNC305MFCol5.2 TaxID=1449076 RepID=UPI0009DFB8C0